MRIFKFFSSIETIEPPYSADSKRDPLYHPDLARMSPTALADLPLGPQPHTPASEPRQLAKCA
ncbi:hypothetical protein BN77_1898 [Rhizobium mesoamericanum STM3625]|uniref:Uncharacterized protein n=1 Tax=Rhizobium mesoamericanum STM3625 TaxID=1211777 RepID=K0PLG9_9HYPH|nr:hypothetical protein BN77_1898 [Rhizobium mesoamericanum STM3625]